jgi:hypothetical protein
MRNIFESIFKKKPQPIQLSPVHKALAYAVSTASLDAELSEATELINNKISRFFEKGCQRCIAVGMSNDEWVELTQLSILAELARLERERRDTYTNNDQNTTP